MSGNIPDPPDTPPRGGAHYTLIDIGDMAKRAADNSHATRADMSELKGVVMRHDAVLVAMVPKMDLLLRPRPTPFVMLASVVVIALSLFAIACTVVARTPSAPAPMVVR